MAVRGGLEFRAGGVSGFRVRVESLKLRAGELSGSGLGPRFRVEVRWGFGVGVRFWVRVESLGQLVVLASGKDTGLGLWFRVQGEG